MVPAPRVGRAWVWAAGGSPGSGPTGWEEVTGHGAAAVDVALGWTDPHGRGVCHGIADDTQLRRDGDLSVAKAWL
jgi:hypothetical protein